MKQDWRITNQMDYLQNAALRYQTFDITPESDHEHCSFCCEKFSLSEHDLIIDIWYINDRTIGEVEQSILPRVRLSMESEKP